MGSTAEALRHVQQICATARDWDRAEASIREAWWLGAYQGVKLEDLLMAARLHIWPATASARVDANYLGYRFI